MRFFRYARLALVLSAICWGAVQAEGAPKRVGSDCSDLVAQLKVMRKAQSTLMQTMVRKNESMAETLDLYADRFSKQQGFVKKNDLSGLKKSAQSFRKHAAREDGIVKKFEAAADQLMVRIETCLQQRKVARK